LVVHRVLTPVAAEAGEESGESLVFQTVVGADREGELANEGERQRAHQILRELSAEVVFDSNRSGTFGIYRVKSGSVEPEVIIDTPERHEVFPDVSLDGNFIVFASARSAGRNAEADIWMVRPDGVGAKRIAENGTFPTVSSDGKRVYFERDRVRLMVVELEGGGERELFPGGASNEWGGYQVIKPRVSPDGSGVVFTSDREGRWSAWAVELASGKGRRIARGCEPGWWGIENFWVKKSGAKERSGIYVKNGENEVPLIDRDAPWGHEYFPTVTGEVLLYAACPPNQHAHESSNYQLFLTQVGRNGVPTRLTFDRHTNRWPKLLRRSGAGE
jgi:hypothetical protein